MRSAPRLAFVVCLLLALVHTWPIGKAPASNSLNSHADVLQWEWTLSWLARTIVRDPVHLFDGNVFAPEPRVLTYSDPVIVPALMGAPARWLGASPALTFNLVLIAGLALTAWAGWFVVWRWTGSVTAALVAGALTAFNAHVMTRFAHVPATHVWGLPLALYFTDAIMRTPRRRDAVLLALVVLAMAATSLYTLFFAAVVIAVVLLGGLAGGGGSSRWRAAGAVAGSAIAGLVLALPVLWPYIELGRTGATRPLEMVAQFSATPAGYLTSLSHLHAGWTSRFFRDDVNVFFAGVTAIALAGIGLTVTLGQREHRRRGVVLVALAIAGVWLSFGPATTIYQWMYAWVPPLRGLRAAARFGYLYLLVIAIASGLGVAWLERRTRSRLAAGFVGLGALALVTLEAWSGPLETQRFTRVPPIYELVANETTPVMLVEIPFWATDLMADNAEYMLNATAHWKPVMNGYSGAIPDSYRRRSSAFWFFPQPWTIDAIRTEGATHVMLHLERLGADERPAFEQALESRQDFRLLASDAGGHRLYKVER